MTYESDDIRLQKLNALIDEFEAHYRLKHAVVEEERMDAYVARKMRSKLVAFHAETFVPPLQILRNA